MRHREKKVLARPAGTVMGKHTIIGNPTYVAYATSPAIYSEYAWSDDETHSHWKARRKRKATGGPCDLQSNKVSSNTVRVKTDDGLFRYEGLMYSIASAKSSKPYPDALTTTFSHGPTGWNKFRPGQPAVSMGVFLGELRDLPGMLRDTCKRLAGIHRALRRKDLLGLSYEAVAKKGGKQLAQDYLSYQFGWLPFLGDIIRCYEVSNTIDQRLRRIRENNGKTRRVGGTIGVTKDITSGPYANYGLCINPSLSSTLYLSPPSAYFTTQVVEKFSFRGAFRYWIPDIGSLRWERNTKRLLYGLTINPEVIWNLIPWSWLVDWFLNIGDSIANIDNGWADNLTAKYAYVMGTYETHTTYSGRAVLRKHGAVEILTNVISSAKTRAHATPYGFGASFTDLSAKRLAILAALGVTRLKAMPLFR